MNLNKIFLLGRLTADPQLRTTTNGNQVATFSIATNRIWNDKISGRREETEYHNIVVWGRQADVASRFLIKGGLVLVEGRVQTRTWEDQQGQKRKITEIVAERMQLGPKPGIGKVNNNQQPQSLKSEVPTIDLDDSTEVQIDNSVETEEIKKEDIPF